MSHAAAPSASAPRAASVSWQEVEGWGKAAGAVGAALWAVFGPLGRWFLRRRRQRQEAERTIRYLADAVHVLLRDRVPHCRMPDGDRWEPLEDDLEQQAARVYEQRNALFRADGHEPPQRVVPPIGARDLADVVQLIKRTQAIKSLQEREEQQQQQTGDEHR
jgi:hypothetical protein